MPCPRESSGPIFDDAVVPVVDFVVYVAIPAYRALDGLLDEDGGQYLFVDLFGDPLPMKQKRQMKWHDNSPLQHNSCFRFVIAKYPK